MGYSMFVLGGKRLPLKLRTIWHGMAWYGKVEQGFWPGISVGLRLFRDHRCPLLVLMLHASTSFDPRYES